VELIDLLFSLLSCMEEDGRRRLVNHVRAALHVAPRTTPVSKAFRDDDDDMV
jgi:hypothetical protein